jgi:hypothetical protein
MRPYKLTYYIYSTAHALGTCTEHVTSSEDTRDVTPSNSQKPCNKSLVEIDKSNKDLDIVN